MWEKKKDLDEIDSLNSEEESDHDRVDALTVNPKNVANAFKK